MWKTLFENRHTYLHTQPSIQAYIHRYTKQAWPSVQCRKLMNWNEYKSWHVNAKSMVLETCHHIHTTLLDVKKHTTVLQSVPNTPLQESCYHGLPLPSPNIETWNVGNLNGQIPPPHPQALHLTISWQACLQYYLLLVTWHPSCDFNTEYISLVAAKRVFHYYHATPFCKVMPRKYRYSKSSYINCF